MNLEIGKSGVQRIVGTVDLVIQCDASEGVLGAALLQDGRPLPYASRALTAVEENYAPIEKELLAIVFVRKRFHKYTKLPCRKLKVPLIVRSRARWYESGEKCNKYFFSTFRKGAITKSM